MTQEEKELLLKDLCARLPYGVIVETPKGRGHVCDINLTIFGNEVGVNINPTSRDKFNIEECKPYLFPLSSMTEEQRIMLEDWDMNEPMLDISGERQVYIAKSPRIIDWFNANHFDYRGLIPKGLAIDCTKLKNYL